MDSLRVSRPQRLRRRGPRGVSVAVRLLQGVIVAVDAILGLSTAYLIALLLAARSSIVNSLSSEHAPGRSRLQFVVLIPAHNEEAGIQGTLHSLGSIDYPREHWTAIVIADNCTDATAARAREAGAETWERTDPERPGKGSALAWALEQLEGDALTFDAVAIVDADCQVSSNLLSAMEERLVAGAEAVQVNYVVGNADASHVAALRYAAFVLIDTVRPLGKQRLSFSCGLLGTGMGFSAALLGREPWNATGLAEDGEYHMHLVAAGVRVAFIMDACVRSAMPTSYEQGSAQQARWEQGKLHTIRAWSPRLVALGLHERDLARVHAGLELLVPPQSLLAAGSLTTGATSAVFGFRRLALFSAGMLGAQLAFVVGGLWLVRAPAHVYRSLMVAPALIVRKVTLYGNLLRGRGPKSWVRTEREAATTADRSG